MFETVRRHRNWLLPILTVAAFVPFIFSGIYGFTHNIGSPDSVAKIGGESISSQELDLAVRNRIARMAAMLPNVNPDMLDTPEVRAAAFDQLLSDKALDLEAAKSHLMVSDARLREAIASIPEFQRNGRFDYVVYRRMLTTRGYEERDFETRLRTDIDRQLLESAVASSAFLPITVSERLFALIDQRRRIQVLPFPAEAYRSQVRITDAAVKAAYDADRNAYHSPEHATVQYLVLSLADLAAGITIPESELRAEYDAHRARWGATSQVRASHILFAVPSGASAAEREKARLRAEKVLQILRAHPDEFAALARKDSQDPVSAAKGGDLGWFGHGVMPKPFEQVAFGLKDGETSGVVATPFGYHILRVTGIRGAQAKPFAAVRAAIEDRLRKDEAARRYATEAEQFSDFVYENPDDLRAAAAKFHLPLQTLDALPRTGPSQPALAAVFTPTVLAATFAPDSVSDHHNTKAIDVGHDTLVSVHVMQFVPAASLPLDAVRSKIEARLQLAAAAKQARMAGEDRLAALRRSAQGQGNAHADTLAGGQKFGAPFELSRGTPGELSAAAVDAIMDLPDQQLPAFVGVTEADGTYAVVHVLSGSEVSPGDARTQARQVRQWMSGVGEAEAEAYVRGLRDRFGAKVLRPDLMPGTAADPK